MTERTREVNAVYQHRDTQIFVVDRCESVGMFGGGFRFLMTEAEFNPSTGSAVVRPVVRLVLSPEAAVQAHNELTRELQKLNDPGTPPFTLKTITGLPDDQQPGEK